MFYTSILFISIFGSMACAHRILILYPTPAHSHQAPAMGLTASLVKKGHEVFVLSSHAVPGLEKNYTHINFPWMYDYFRESLAKENVTMQQQFSLLMWIPFWEVYSGTTRQMFESDEFKNFLQRVQTEKISFDVIIVESFFIPYGVALARLLTGNKPVIAMYTFVGGDYHEEDAIGSIKHLSYTPTLLSSFTDKMNVWERLQNWIMHHYMSSRLGKIVENSARAHFRETYGPSGEALVEDSWANISLALMTSNSLYYYPRPIAPNVIEVGPLHIKTPEKLPKILQDWLDGADKGVIYFSLGSNMQSKSLPDGALSNFLRIFRELPEGYRVLWKWENDGKIPGQSSNILTRKWIPQQSVLAHPKVRMFITQGGCQSFQETVHFGVPTLGIPWFGDQELNVAKMVDAEIGVRLRPNELSSYNNVKAAIDALLFDDRYAKNMKKLSEISHDFTSRAHDEAVFWVEHVAKHGGAAHLRPNIADTSYFEYFCLDVISIILGIIILTLYCVWKTFRIVISSLFSPSSEKIKTS